MLTCWTLCDNWIAHWISSAEINIFFNKNPTSEWIRSFRTKKREVFQYFVQKWRWYCLLPLIHCAVWKTGISSSYLVSCSKSSKHYYAKQKFFFSFQTRQTTIIVFLSIIVFLFNNHWIVFGWLYACECGVRCMGPRKQMKCIWFTVLFRDQWSDCWTFLECSIADVPWKEHLMIKIHLTFKTVNDFSIV